MADETPTCANCHKTATATGVDQLKACAKCKTTQYCGRECQKAHWKTHKKVCCSKNSATTFINTEHSSSYSAPRLNDIEKHIPNPFTKLDQGTYLHDRPETDVFKLLIDSFRIRQADDLMFENKTTPRSVYTGASSSIEPFGQYLVKAAAHPTLLPPWWTADKHAECVAFGESGAWSDLRKKVTKQEMIQHYGDSKLPMQVRMVAEAVYGTGTMGQDGSNMRKMMVQMESGGSGNTQLFSMWNLGH